jgi:hypothetical protein
MISFPRILTVLRRLLPVLVFILLPLVVSSYEPANAQEENLSTESSELADDHKLIGKAENLSLYAMKANGPSFKQVEQWAGESAVVGIEIGEESDWQRLIVRWPDLEMVLTRESVVDGELFQHLQEFQGYVFNQLAGKQMDAHVFAVITQISRTNHLFVLQADAPMNFKSINFARQFAMSQRAIVFESSEVFDDQLRELLGPGKSQDEAAKFPSFESSVQRKRRSMEQLAEQELKPFEGLPEIAADEAVRLKTPEDVARRFLCLAAVAMKADSKGEFDAKVFLETHKLTDALSPAESEFISAPGDAPENSNMTWRYEAAWTLLWALKLTDELQFGDQECDAKLVIAAAMERAEEVLGAKELRSTNEILDQADLYYRCHWMCTDFRMHKRGSIGKLSPSVVYERLYSLNWLTNYKNGIDWDDVIVDS